jgi:hypothetical protein
VRHDYDEVAALNWTSRLVAAFAVGAFLTALGLAMLIVPLPDGVPVSTVRRVVTWGSLALGLLAMGAGYAVESAQQRGRAAG